MDRDSVLKQALEIVHKDRNLDYGSPEDNFATIAELWQSYFDAIPVDRKVTAHDVAVCMILVKVSRLATSPGKEDHWVDIAGYSACGAQAYDRATVSESDEPVGDPKLPGLSWDEIKSLAPRADRPTINDTSR